MPEVPYKDLKNPVRIVCCSGKQGKPTDQQVAEVIKRLNKAGTKYVIKKSKFSKSIYINVQDLED